MRNTFMTAVASVMLCGAAMSGMMLSSAHAQQTSRDANASSTHGAGTAKHSRKRDVAYSDAQQMAQVCQDRVARQTGKLAYIEAKLNLTDAERPLFERWKETRLSIARHHIDECLQHVKERIEKHEAEQAQGRGQRPHKGPLVRIAREEGHLKQKIADLEVERPALDAFYNSLSADQKKAFGHHDHRPHDDMMRRRKFNL